MMVGLEVVWVFRYEKIGASFWGFIYLFIWNMFDGFMEWYVMKKIHISHFKVCIFIVGVVMLEVYLRFFLHWWILIA